MGSPWAWCLLGRKLQSEEEGRSDRAPYFNCGGEGISNGEINPPEEPP